MLVDDHPIVRQGLKSLLEAELSFEVVASLDDAEQALVEVDRVPCDVVVLDLHLSGKEGLWCLAALKKKHPGLPVLVLTMDRDYRMVVDALKAGASGYLLKSGQPEELLLALRQVSRGETYVHPAVVGPVVAELLAPAAAASASLPKLTSREEQVLALLARGLDAPEVAAELGVSVNTAKTHLHALYRKFEVHDRTRLLLAAFHLGPVRRFETDDEPAA
jgi:DNA-binding NarL/FixJ family response regulator